MSVHFAITCGRPDGALRALLIRMTIANWFALVLVIVGGVLYYVAKNPKVAELGRLTFFVGLGVFTWHFATPSLHIG